MTTKGISPPNKIHYNENTIINSILFIKETESKIYKDSSVIRYGLFRCFCGNEFKSPIHNIFKQDTKSCGCAKSKLISESKKKHGLHNTPEYNSWCSLKSRCKNKNNIQFKDYGGRGIKVCDRWNDKKIGFINFLKDMGRRPSDLHSIDRINVNGNYEKSNCRWATNLQQANNKRDNIYFTCNGETKTLTEWARIADLHRVTLKYRLWKGMTIEEAISTPVDKRFRRKK